MSESTLEAAAGEVRAIEHGELGHAAESVPGLLPGEVRPHPSPFKYVVIAVVLCVITGIEVAVSYLEGDIPDGLIITLLLMMAIMKFWTVASWYMHLQTDKPIFRRFFILGIVAAVLLFTIVLTTFHVFA